MNKVKGGVLFLILLTSFVFASKDFVLGPNGRHYRIDGDVVAITKELDKTRSLEAPQVQLLQEEFELRWPDGDIDSNWGFSLCDAALTGGDCTPAPCAEDWYAQWLVPLARAKVKKFVMNVQDWQGTWEFRIHASNYDGEALSASCANASGWVGRWVDADGNTLLPFDPDSTWEAGDNACFSEPPLGEEIWPGLGMGGLGHEITADDAGSWIEVDLAQIGIADMDSESFFIAGLATCTAGWGIGAGSGAVTPYHSFKYYGTDRTSGNPGWHILSYGWMIYAIVEYYEDTPPFIEDMTELPTTLLTTARKVEATITDSDPTGGGNEGVASATLHYTVNAGTEQTVTMTPDADTFSADIPANITVVDDVVEYWITATDNAGNSNESVHVTYSHYGKSAEAEFVMLFDGLPASGYPSQYYFFDAYGLCKWCDLAKYDIWAYGGASSDLLDLYNTVVEITAGGPIAGNAVEVKTWLDEGSKNYLLAGDEVVGGWFGWPGIPVDIDTLTDETSTAAIPFFQYLGIETYYGDINAASSADVILPWPITAVEGDIISGELFSELGTNTLFYDPAFEIGVSNWLDGFAVDAMVTVAFKATVNDSIEGYPTDPLAVGFYKEDATLNNKLVFLGFDPLSLNSEPYVWWGTTPYAPQFTALEWFGLFDMSVDDDVAQLPKRFALHQNYPNPFNPVTSINFDLPIDGQVSLTIYNMLGQKVATLLNEVRRAGNHTVIWNGRDELGQVVSTGIYLYRIDAGDFTATKKMVLLK